MGTRFWRRSDAFSFQEGSILRRHCSCKEIQLSSSSAIFSQERDAMLAFRMASLVSRSQSTFLI